MTADLPPDVQARAVEALELARRTYDNATLSPNESARALAMSSAVVSVVAEEIERPLQARVTELESTLANARELWDESIAQTSAVVELHGEAHDRVELLTAALTEIANRACEGPDVEDCGDEHVDRDAWCDRCKARAALAAGETEAPPLSAFRNLPDWVPDLTPEQHHARYLEMLREREQAAGDTESEAPSWIRCVCGHSPHKHGDGGTIPPPPTARCHAAHDFDHDCLCEGYRPETESED